MAYQSTGMMALFPIYLQRMRSNGEPPEDSNSVIAQNEVNLNQNLDELARKILEIESYLTQNN